MSRRKGGPGFPITAFIGPNGSGKTLAMTELLALPALESGKPVVSNYRIKHDLWVPLTTWRQLSAVHDCVVLLDEVSSILPSRQFQSMPPELLRRLNQLRKARVIIGWSGPAWARCDVAMREVTQGAVVCQGFWPDRWYRDEGERPFPFSGKVAKDPSGRGKLVSGWRPNRLFKFTTYDARELDDVSNGIVSDEGVRPYGVQWYWRPNHRAHWLYDTSEEVMLMDHLDDVGTCVTCNGTRSRHKCVCDREPRRVEAVEAVEAVAQ